MKKKSVLLVFLIILSTLPSQVLAKGFHFGIISAIEEKIDELRESKLHSPTPEGDDDLEKALNRMPEVYTNAASSTEVEKYKTLISQLPEDAQKWITGMGQFMEDYIVDQNEEELLRVLVSEEDPLVYLSNQRIIDNVSNVDIDWVREDITSSEGYMYLKDDLTQLQEKGLFSEQAKQALDRLVEMAKSDYELKKGLYLIKNFGHPAQNMFPYSIPEYNTQLFILGKLLERGVPQGYERVAVAASLAYGSVYTIADEEVKALLPSYAYNRIKFIQEIDNFIWQAKDYPLEADIGLVWGAPAVRYWSINGPIFWSNIFQTNHAKMGTEDFHWLFVETDTLRDMNQWMVQRGFVDLSIEDPAIDKRHITDMFPEEYNEKIDKVMADLNDYLYFGKNHFTGNPNEIVDVEGRKVKAGEICNPDWQWEQFTKYGYFYGTCMEDTTTENIFAKSINVASHYGFIYAEKNRHVYTHSIIHYYNPVDNLVRTTPCQVYFYETTGHPGSPPVSHDGHVPVPWQNFCYELGWQRFHQRSQKANYTIYAKGFPVGYIFRSYFGSHPFS